MKIVILIAIQLALASSLYAETYKWVDEKGTIHFSDSPPPQKHIAQPKTGVSAKTLVKEKEREINRIYSKGRKLFKDKKYVKALPYYFDALNEFRKLYSKHPDRFHSSYNRIMEIHTKLAGYYRWKEGKPEKAIDEYKKLLYTLDKFKTNEMMTYPIWFLMGEIYEKELKDYEEALRCYEKVTELIEPKDKKGENKLFIKSTIDWFSFLVEKVNVLHLKKSNSFSQRTLKYPSVEYAFFLQFFVNASAFSDASFVDEDFMNYASNYYSIEAMDKLSLKYPTSYQMMFFGINLFHRYLGKKDIDKAMKVADKLFDSYPYDLNMVMLQFQIADVYQLQKDEAKYKEATEKGLKMAKALNIDMVLGADERFSSPEKTWQMYVAALKKRDINEAVNCFSPSSQDKYRQIFTALEDKLDEMAAEMKIIGKIKESEGRAQYRIRRVENRQEITYYISFTNVLGEWKIEQF